MSPFFQPFFWVPTYLLFVSLSFLFFSFYLSSFAEKDSLPISLFPWCQNKNGNCRCSLCSWLFGFASACCWFFVINTQLHIDRVIGLPKPFPMWIVVTLCGTKKSWLLQSLTSIASLWTGVTRWRVGIWCWMLSHQKTRGYFPLKYWLFYRDPPSLKWCIITGQYHLYNNPKHYFHGSVDRNIEVNCWQSTGKKCCL